jgi:hypothetical protein
VLLELERGRGVVRAEGDLGDGVDREVRLDVCRRVSGTGVGERAHGTNAAAGGYARSFVDGCRGVDILRRDSIL